jgi:hypothetical protein
MRRAVRCVRAALVLLTLLGCASTGGLPRNPFDDITVPETFRPYSEQWVFIKSPTVAAARLVYMTQLGLDDAMAAVRATLTRDGWAPETLTPSTSQGGFRLLSLNFVKGSDTCRVRVIEGAHATHVDLTVARLTK